MATEYRIDFTITRRRDGDEDFSEVGFGSSGAWETIAAAAHSLNSAIQNCEWETAPGMPQPGDLEDDHA